MDHQSLEQKSLLDQIIDEFFELLEGNEEFDETIIENLKKLVLSNKLSNKVIVEQIINPSESQFYK